MKLMLKRYFLKIYSLVFLSIIFISSCNLDEFDFDKLSDQVTYKPGLAFPIARVKATIEDFLDKGYIKESILKLLTLGIIMLQQKLNNGKEKSYMK